MSVHACAVAGKKKIISPYDLNLIKLYDITFYYVYTLIWPHQKASAV